MKKLPLQKNKFDEKIIICKDSRQEVSCLVILNVIGSMKELQQLPFDAFMVVSLQEVEHQRLSDLELMKDQLINLAVSTLSTMITSRRSDEAITAVAPVVEPLVEVTSLADVEYLIIRDEEVDPSDFKRSNVEAAERATTEAVQHSVSFILLMRVEFQRMTQSIRLRNERLKEEKMITAQDETIINVMRFWATVRELLDCGES